MPNGLYSSDVVDLLEPSYIPSPEVMQLRLLTRRLRSYKQRQTQIKNEIHNLLQRANIKLTRLSF